VGVVARAVGEVAVHRGDAVVELLDIHAVGDEFFIGPRHDRRRYG